MKVGIYTDRLDELIVRSAGILTTSAAVRSGIPKDAFYRYVRNRGLEREFHGVYVAKNVNLDELALLQVRFSKVVFSHDTALFLHGMSARKHIPLSVSVESGYNSPSLKDQGVRIYYVKPEWHSLGVCEVTTPEDNKVRAYDKERTICDLIRKRGFLDVTEFNHVAKSYIASKDKNLSRLSEYARAMNMESRVWDAIGVLL